MVNKKCFSVLLDFGFLIWKVCNFFLVLLTIYLLNSPVYVFNESVKHITLKKNPLTNWIISVSLKFKNV